MSVAKKPGRTTLPSSIPSGTAQPVVVSGAFISALKQAGARPSVVAALEKELAEATK